MPELDHKYSLAILASHVIQYQDPLFRLLAAHPRIDLTVFFCSRHGAARYFDKDMGVSLEWDIEPLRGYRHEFLRNVSPFPFHSPQFNLINPGIFRVLKPGRFDALIVMFGWGSISSWLAVLACKRSRTPFLPYGDSSFVPSNRGVRGRLREAILRTLFRHTDAFLVSGEWNARYYSHYGGDPSKFFLVPWAVDNDRFASASRIIPEERRMLRGQYGIDPERVLIVFSGKLIPRKDPLILLEALARMKRREQTAVMYIGDGELRGELEQYAKRHALQVSFPGFVNQSALPRMYAAADIFVLPSRFEPRGAVVNEAMACGLPVVTSTMVGSNGDIVRDGDNGSIFPVGDSQRLAEILDPLVDSPELRAKMGQRSREIIESWDYQADVNGILQALGFVTGSGF